MNAEEHPGAKKSAPRRRAVLTGAGLAVAGLAVGAAVPITVSALQDEPVRIADEEAMRPMRVGPVVVHLRDADSGQFDLFVGTNEFQFTDQALVARLMRVAADG